jgi:RNA polymerase sigma-70 factor (ECF subfamily)
MSSSLLVRLKANEPEAWRRLVRLYYPLVRKWCQRSGLKHEDAADVAQEVFRALAGNVARFRYEKGQTSFRAWMYGITSRQLLAHWRQQKQRPVAAGGSEAHQRFAELAEWGPDEVNGDSAVFPADERHEVLRRALRMMRDGVASHTWEAFWRSVVEGQAPADIAADLGVSVNAVYIAKARMLSRLREEFGELIE